MDKEEPKIDLIETWGSTRIRVFLQTTATTIIVIAILAGGGYLLDQQVQTYPTFFLIGLIASFPITQVVLYKQLRKYAKKKING